MAQVKDYYPGDYYGDLRATLAWLFARQNAPIAGWQGNALGTPTTQVFEECGIVSTPDFSGFAQTAIENIVIDPPVGILPDNAKGPDGFPINFSPQGLPTGNILLNVFQSTVSQTVAGRCFSLLQPLANYRVDLFSRTDKFYYQGSSSLTSIGGGVATWSVSAVAIGSVIAVLYPSTVPQPGSGSSFTVLPAGWLAHSNMGVGKKLSAYIARLFVKTDIEYLQEDNVPIIIQDSHHARCGSGVIPNAGTMTVHILYNDPTNGYTTVFTSLQTLAAYKDLPRSFGVPTSDPLYVPDPTVSNAAALQNRSFIYDDALAIIAYSAAGNFVAASKIVRQLNTLLDNPGYLASLVLENAEDGSTARWTAVNGTVANLSDPAQPPYGTGNVLKFHSSVAGATFTYAGVGFPDNTDTQIQFQHREPGAVTFSMDIGVTSALATVTDVLVTSDTAGPATFNAATKTITVPTGPGSDKYRFVLLNLQSLISSLASDTLSSITGFKVTLSVIGDMYFDNLSVGTQQPANSLSFSYDVYNGQIDQAYIRAGAMAWVCYAYSLYMQMSLDYSPALYLQRMINFLLTLQSAAADLTNSLFYLGYGKYMDPGYQFVPGRQQSISTEHQVDLYFAFKRAALLLPTAATQLLKTGAITPAQAASLNVTATSVSSVADTIWTKLSNNLYIAPGADPGHFAQGASPAGLDTSQALDASGTWTAILAHVVGDDTKATECLKFAYLKFYIQNQQILLSSATNTYNQAYQQLTPFSGFKPYNDSGGGYSGSPASVWQEGSWGMILALLRLHDVSTVASYFASVQGTIDSFLTTLIADQRTVLMTTAKGSLLGYSLAARSLPWEFEVWPMLAGTAWFWLTATNPALLLSVTTDPQTLPYLKIPQGQNQGVTELDGQSSMGQLLVETIDPGGTLKSLAAQQNLVGKVARLKLGFPSVALGDFVPLHTVQITSVGYTPEGRLQFECADVQRFLTSQIWINGGPAPWTPGQPAASQPVGRSWLPNAFPCSDKNPRWLAGNPLEIYLAAMQNELGVGQDPALPQTAWAIYQPGLDSTLINPNPSLDVPGILALRDGMFSGDWFEFKIMRVVEGKTWIESEILKPLGLYQIVRWDGRLALKSMKSPAALAPVMALNQTNIIGIPSLSRLPVINTLTVRMSVDDSQRETLARQYKDEVIFQQSTSVFRYKQQLKHLVEAIGLRFPYGGWLRSFILADRIFRRRAFSTPKYKVKTWLTALTLELGDFVWLNHSNVPDLQSGTMGLTNVACEVVGRQPNYAEGSMGFELLDTRFISLTTAYQVVPASASIPNYSQATPAQRQQYMFISLAATGGLNADGTPGNTIF